jgi:hypothetical protein
MSPVEQQQQFVAVPGGECLVTLDRTDTCRATVVCAHGLTGDRSGPMELLSDWSHALATAGYAVVRLDFRGSGDSSGSWAETSFPGMVSDFVAVSAWARDTVDAPLVAAGISTGGVVACLASADVLPIGLLLLSSDFWEDPDPTDRVKPIRDGEFHEPEALGRGRRLLQPRVVLGALPIPTCLVYGTEDDLLMQELPALSGLMTTKRPVPGSGHLFESRRARDELRVASLSFLSEVAP